MAVGRTSRASYRRTQYQTLARALPYPSLLGWRGLGQGGVAGARWMESAATPPRPPLSAAFERLGADPDLADYFLKIHAEIVPFEQDEGWESLPTVLKTGEQRRRCKRAYIEKILSERRKDEGLLRRTKKLSGLS